MLIQHIWKYRGSWAPHWERQSRKFMKKKNLTAIILWQGCNSHKSLYLWFLAHHTQKLTISQQTAPPVLCLARAVALLLHGMLCRSGDTYTSSKRGFLLVSCVHKCNFLLQVAKLNLHHLVSLWVIQIRMGYVTIENRIQLQKFYYTKE